MAICELAQKLAATAGSKSWADLRLATHTPNCNACKLQDTAEHNDGLIPKSVVTKLGATIESKPGNAWISTEPVQVVKYNGQTVGHLG